MAPFKPNQPRPRSASRQVPLLVLHTKVASFILVPWKSSSFSLFLLLIIPSLPLAPLSRSFYKATISPGSFVAGHCPLLALGILRGAGDGSASTDLETATFQ